MVGRLGGGELVRVRAGRGLADAQGAAERVRRVVADRRFAISLPATTLPVTVSIGLRGLDAGDDAPDLILRRADEGLYEAKRTGRDRVVMREAATRTQQMAIH